MTMGGRIGVAVLVALSSVGCTLGSASQSPQSHFTFPNSNVIPLKEARGSSSKLCGLLGITPGAPDAEDQEAATREALDRSGGDLLINVRTDTRIFNAFLFAICTTKVRGTAAKMEVGRQQLSPMSGAQPPPVAPPRAGGCTSDQDCKAGRVCREGACTSP